LCAPPLFCYDFTKYGAKEIAKQSRVNQEIRANNLRVIGEDGRQLGVLSRLEALRAAEEAGLDLVEVSPNAEPPVASIVDWGKYRHQQSKQAQQTRQKTLD